MYNSARASRANSIVGRMDEEMQGVVLGQRNSVKRGPPGALEPEAKRLRASLVYGEVLSVEEITDEDQDMDVDNNSRRTSSQFQQWSRTRPFADNETSRNVATALDSHYRLLRSELRTTAIADVRRSFQGASIASHTTSIGEIHHYAFTDTQVSIHLVNGEQITKKRAHTHSYIATLELEATVLRNLDKDPHWSTTTFDTLLLAEARHRFFNLETRKRWVMQRLRERAGGQDITMEDA